MVFIRRTNKGAEGNFAFTRMQVAVKDMDELAVQVDKILKEVNETEYNKSIPSLLALGKNARLGHKEAEFWKHGTWTSTSGSDGTGGIRCRAVENSSFAVSLVVNTPRTSTAYGAGYIGPILTFQVGTLRALFPKIRENLQRFYNNTD